MLFPAACVDSGQEHMLAQACTGFRRGIIVRRAEVCCKPMEARSVQMDTRLVTSVATSTLEAHKDPTLCTEYRFRQMCVARVPDKYADKRKLFSLIKSAGRFHEA